MRWGLIPPWFKAGKSVRGYHIARAETIHELQTFRPAFERRRCLVPATAYYEWTKTLTGKIVYAAWHGRRSDRVRRNMGHVEGPPDGRKQTDVFHRHLLGVRPTPAHP